MKYTILISIAISVLSLVSCDSKNAPKESEKAITVSVAQVETTNSARNYSYSGQIQIEERSRVSFLVGGIVDKLFYDEGDQVKKGTLLAHLSATDFANELELQQARLLEAEDTYNRFSTLYEKKSLPESDYVQSKARYLSMKAAVNISKKKMFDTRIHAPYNATIISKFVQNGTILEPGMPVYELANVDDMVALLNIPQNEIDNIKLNNTIEIIIPSLNDKKIQAVVTAVIPVADKQTRTYSVKAKINNPESTVKDGMLVNANISTDESLEKITVPGNSVTISPDNQHYVFVYDEQSKTVIKTKVRIGKPMGSQLSIESGLKVNDKIVVQGQTRLRDGVTVNISNND